MKKILLAILLVALLFALSVPAMAADTKITVTASDSTVEINPNGTVEVKFTVSISGDVPFTSAGYMLKFDETKFTYKGHELIKKSAMGEAVDVLDLLRYDTDTNTCMVTFSEPYAYTGKLVTITLELKQGASIGEAEVGGQVSCVNGNDSVAIGISPAKVNIGCDHDYGKWAAVEGKDEHSRVCSKCNTPKTEKHEWKLQKDTSTGNCEQASQKDYKCEACGATKTDKVSALKHTFDNECDSTCNNTGCKYKRDAGHTFTEEYVTNETSHWYECTTCHAKKSEYPHTPGDPATETTPQVCIHCQYVLAAAAHAHEISETWYSDAESHWHRCEKSGCYFTQDKVAHDYDNACDVDCNTCGAIRVPPHTYNPEWKGNSQGHWNICTECGAQSEIFPHEPGAEATMDTPQTCVDCNFWVKWPLSHEHNFGEQWYSDEEYHWQSCVDCSEVAEKQLHAWGEDTILQEATDTEKGSVMRTCTVCGKQVTEEIPPTGGTADPGDATAPGDPGASDKDTGKGRFPWEIAGIAAAILLIVGIVLLVIEYIRSRKINMHGKFSK